MLSVEIDVGDDVSAVSSVVVSTRFEVVDSHSLYKVVMMFGLVVSSIIIVVAPGRLSNVHL